MSGKKKQQRKIIYWDACIFIAYAKDESRSAGQMAGVYYWANEIQHGRVIVVTSNMTRVEVLECTLTDEQKKRFENFLKRSNVSTPAADNRVMSIAHGIRDYYQKRKLDGEETLPTVATPDSIHLATAIQYECEEFHTFDANDHPGPNNPRRALIPLSGNVAGKYSLKVCIPASPTLTLFN